MGAIFRSLNEASEVTEESAHVCRSAWKQAERFQSRVTR